MKSRLCFIVPTDSLIAAGVSIIRTTAAKILAEISKPAKTTITDIEYVRAVTRLTDRDHERGF